MHRLKKCLFDTEPSDQLMYWTQSHWKVHADVFKTIKNSHKLLNGKINFLLFSYLWCSNNSLMISCGCCASSGTGEQQ